MGGDKVLSFVLDTNSQQRIQFKANGVNWQASCSAL